ncbi:MAG: hypothetical protein WAU56_12965, partial [Steroidobacteraceae bacterium]
MILAYRAEVRWLESRPADELGAARSAPLVLAGLLLGAALFAGVYAVLWSVGVVAYAGPGSAAGAVTMAALAAGAAVGEEIIFRGGVLRILRQIWPGGLGRGARAVSCRRGGARRSHRAARRLAAVRGGSALTPEAALAAPPGGLSV